MIGRATILVFDSGLGGLTVLREVQKVRPDARFIYAADDAGFPYGDKGEEELGTRIEHVMAGLIQRFRPDLVVIACGTASTLLLPRLRARFHIPFVGTVPAIKPAARMSQSRIIAVLATPATVRRDYTQDLIQSFASDCHVVLVGAPRLAAQAEAHLRGEAIDERVIAEDCAPCFVEREGRRTDVVTLSCTHFPLLTEVLQRLAPWPVSFIDPAPAIARRVGDLLGLLGDAGAGAPAGIMFFTSGQPPNAYLRAILAQHGLSEHVADVTVI